MINRKRYLTLPLILLLIPFSSLSSQSEEAANIFENYKQGVVTFVSYGEDKEEIAQGSGFIIGEKILLLNDPPNSTPQIIANPDARSPNYRDSDQYIEMCRNLRQRMDIST